MCEAGETIHGSNLGILRVLWQGVAKVSLSFGSVAFPLSIFARFYSYAELDLLMYCEDAE